MDTLQVRTGQISLLILDDNEEERGVFRFNPEDVESAKTVIHLQQELAEKQADMEAREKYCTTPQEKIDLMSEAVQYFRGLVDNCFGEGSSELVFGDNNTLSMFEDFFNGIMPYYEKASKKRMQKYRKPKTNK